MRLRRPRAEPPPCGSILLCTDTVRFAMPDSGTWVLLSGTLLRVIGSAPDRPAQVCVELPGGSPGWVPWPHPGAVAWPAPIPPEALAELARSVRHLQAVDARSERARLRNGKGSA